MLGFDALGRLALGAATAPAITNATLTAATGGFVETGKSAVFLVRQPSNPVSVALAGNAAYGRLTEGAGIAVFTTSASPALFAWRMPAAFVSYIVTPNSFSARLGLAAASGATNASGRAAAFKLALNAEQATVTLLGFPSGFTRDFEAWFPRPFDVDGWSSSAAPAQTWTPSAILVETWTAKAGPAPSWTTVPQPPDLWTSE